jgi:hypothetical protein
MSQVSIVGGSSMLVVLPLPSCVALSLSVVCESEYIASLSVSLISTSHWLGVFLSLLQCSLVIIYLQYGGDGGLQLVHCLDTGAFLWNVDTKHDD